MLPERLLLDRSITFKEERLKMEDGMLPVSDAPAMFNISNRERLPISAGTPPEKRPSFQMVSVLHAQVTLINRYQ